jgi:hypothetical protein
MRPLSRVEERLYFAAFVRSADTHTLKPANPPAGQESESESFPPMVYFARG